MTSLVHWSAGSLVGLTWSTSYFNTALFASLANGACLASSQLANATALDQYLDLSFSLQTAAATSAGTSFVSVYLLPLNQDGSTYGDNSLSPSSTLTGTPGTIYYAGAAQIGAVISSGSQATGMISRIIIPPGSFILALQNNLGSALGSSTNFSKAAVRTYVDAVG